MISSARQTFLKDLNVQNLEDLDIAKVKDAIEVYEYQLGGETIPGDDAPDGYYDDLRKCLCGAKDALRELREEAGLDDEIDMAAEEEAMFPEGRDPDSEDPDDFGCRDE
jgi:hypothetical protein